MKKIIYPVILMAYCGAALAQDSGWFVSGGVGYGQGGLKSIQVQGSDVKTDLDSTTLSVEVGYQINRNVSVNLGYRDVGSLRIYRDTGADQFSASIKGSAVTLGGTYSHPLSEQVDISAHAGVYRWTYKLDAPQGAGQVTERGSKGYFGSGVSYSLTPQTSVGANWTRFKSPEMNMDDQDIFEAVVKYRF